jgi:hypothetical protein
MPATWTIVLVPSLVRVERSSLMLSEGAGADEQPNT